MLKDFISKTLSNQLNYPATPDQEKLMDICASFIMNKGAHEILLVKGYAGTGKTSMINAISKTLIELKFKTFLMAPTGRASKVLSSYTGKNAYTIHKKIYRLKSSNDGFGAFELDKNLHTNTFFIVDEASMIGNQSFELSNFGSGNLLQDLISYVYNEKNCKLILVGDLAQLPPVGLIISPALDAQRLTNMGFSVKLSILKHIVRQEKDSGILQNATHIRQQIEQNNTSLPKFNVEGYDDIIRLPGDELVEKISDMYDTYGLDDVMVINRSNKRSNKYNQGIRNQILWREEEISTGDYVMVVRNNYFWMTEEDEDIDFIANGDIAEIVKIHNHESLYGYHFVDVTLRLIDHKHLEIDAVMFLDTLHIDSASLSNKARKELFYTIMEDYADMPKKKQYKKVKENRYFNALEVKFAHAVTCHKAQGGQWKAIFIDQGYITEETVNIEYLRWLYTALTRASEKVFLVNFSEKFFE